MEDAEDRRVREIDPEVLEEFRRGARPGSAWREFLDRSAYYAMGMFLLVTPVAAAAGYFIWGDTSDELSSDELVWLMDEERSPSPSSSKTSLDGNVESTESALFVESSPAGAEVLLDGSSIGNTPIDGHRVEPGVYVLSIQQEPYPSLDTVVFVSEDEPTVLLDINFARAVVGPRDAAAALPRSTPDAGREPVRSTTPDAGREPVRSTTADADRPQRLPTTTPPSPAAEPEDTANAPDEQPPVAQESTAEPRSGTVTVLVRPFGTIYVDGVLRKENTDVKYDISLPVGRHVIRAYHPVLGEREVTVDVADDRPQSVVVDLLTQRDE